jgi:hypothetical protein
MQVGYGYCTELENGTNRTGSSWRKFKIFFNMNNSMSISDSSSVIF